MLIVLLLAMTIVLAIYDSAGTLVPGILAVMLYIMKAIPSSCVSGMPFLSAYTPVIE